MIKKTHHVLAFCLAVLLPILGLAEAPVVDESDNFMVLDEAQVAEGPSVARAQNAYARNESYGNEEEMALAQDNSPGPVQNNVELLGQLKGMQQEMRELRGQLEVQAHELQLLKDQQLSFYKDIDSRFQKQSSANNTPSTLDFDKNTSPKTPDLTSNTKAAPQNTVKSNIYASKPAAAPIRNTNPADEQISYLAAYDLVKNKRYEDALLAMQEFVSRYPNGGYTANAQYWLGELFMLQRDHTQAIQHFEIVLKQFPNSSKAAASSLKIGYALAASGKKAEARQRLQQVVRNYPDTPTAQLAVTKLMTINAT